MIFSARALEVRLSRRVHPGLALDVEFRLGDECGILFGPSGSGKSTILRLIAGLDRPDSGHVRLAGEVLFDSKAGILRPLRERRIGLIFQDDLLFPHLSVEGNVRFGLHRRPRREADARLAEVAALCGVGHLLGRRPGSLSGGERQRVGLARALAPRPRLLLCDEPVSALDLDSRHALIGVIRSIQRAEAIPVLYVTHAPDEAVAVGDRLLLLSGGGIVADGPPLDVLAARPTAAPAGWDSLRNTLPAVVLGHGPGGRSTVQLVDGPPLIVPHLDRPAGSRVVVVVLADDILLARGPIGTISARNLLDATVVRVVAHGTDAEVEVRTGGVTWVVGVVSAAVEELELVTGAEVRMIVKARSCRVIGE